MGQARRGANRRGHASEAVSGLARRLPGRGRMAERPAEVRAPGPNAEDSRAPPTGGGRVGGRGQGGSDSGGGAEGWLRTPFPDAR